MVKLGREMTRVLIAEFGPGEFIHRIADPVWFQSLGTVLAFDWNASGLTTILTAALKEAIRGEERDLGVFICGGKGKTSRKTPQEITSWGDRLSLPGKSVDNLVYNSRMSAKVDNTAIQAGYQLYHHAFFLAENRKWAVVQQGMCLQDRTARRFHWLSEKTQTFVVEPHNAIVGDVKHDNVLDMTSSISEGCRKASVDIAKERPEKIMRMIVPTSSSLQKSLEAWLPKEWNPARSCSMEFLSMPRNINWKTLKAVYEFQPSNYEELLSFKGVGPATVRGLALVAEVIYGEKPSWKDPVKYSFAYGGKDEVPYPVDRRAMDESIQMLSQTIQEAKVGNEEKMHSLQRLRRFIPHDAEW
jgi:hypothetical protein